MLIHADVNEVHRPAFAPAPASVLDGRRAYGVDPGLFVDHRGDLTEEPEPPPVEEIDVPADPDGDLEPVGARPSLLDEIAALMPSPRAPERQAPAYARHRPNGTQFRSRFNNRDWGRTAWDGPGSMTRAVGVGGDLRGNQQGDGMGNVTRDNFAHFGAVGTRSR